jgi:hypothetical protein
MKPRRFSRLVHRSLRGNCREIVGKSGRGGMLEPIAFKVGDGRSAPSGRTTSAPESPEEQDERHERRRLPKVACCHRSPGHSCFRRPNRRTARSDRPLPHERNVLGNNSYNPTSSPSETQLHHYARLLSSARVKPRPSQAESSLSTPGQQSGRLSTMKAGRRMGSKQLNITCLRVHPSCTVSSSRFAIWRAFLSALRWSRA